MSLSLNEWLDLLESRHPKSIDLGLDRVREVWQRMGAPVPAARIFIVGGTNGKGSTVSYLCRMLGAMGHCYGSYTTPHLLVYNERIQINGKPVTDDEIVLAFEQIEGARGEISLTYFEFGTLAAIYLMHTHSLDFAVMEVGLGGRLDAVNILDADCTIITPVGLDHQDYLGPDRETIGREKAGILRPGVPLFCGESDPPESVVAEARKLGSPLYRLGHEFSAQVKGRSVEFHTQQVACTLPLPAMRGTHQVRNMATSVAALLHLLPDTTAMPESVMESLQEVRIPGRMEQLCSSPLVLVDVGHNPLAAHAVEQAIALAAQFRPGGQCHCVIAMLEDKDASEVAAILDPVVSDWYCAGLDGDRGQSAVELSRQILSSVPTARVLVCQDAAGAFNEALNQASDNDCVLVFGSFLTAAAAMKQWKLREAGPNES